MRLEPNISLRKEGEAGLPPYKVEVKNINSFRFAGLAINYEIERHKRLLDEGKIPPQETRGWDEAKNGTVSQRSKEEAADYRYFPEPDIPPMRFTKHEIEAIRKNLPELPEAKHTRFMNSYGITDADATVLTDDRDLADFYEDAVNVAVKEKFTEMTPKKIANWLINKKPDISSLVPASFIKEMYEATKIVKMDSSKLETIVDTIIAEQPKAVADFKAGKQQSLMFLFGLIMRQVKGQATADDIKALLEAKLK